MLLNSGEGHSGTSEFLFQLFILILGRCSNDSYFTVILIYVMLAIDSSSSLADTSSFILLTASCLLQTKDLNRSQITILA